MSEKMPTNDEEFLRQEQVAESQEWRQTQEIYADLGTYIKMNKEIALSSEDPEMTEQAKKSLQDKIGAVYAERWFQNLESFYSNFPGKGSFYYIDKEGNIAYVKLDVNKIVSYKEQGFSSTSTSAEIDAFNKKIASDLAELGFLLPDKNKNKDKYSEIEAVAVWASNALRNKRSRLEKEAEEQKQERNKKEFDF